MAPSRPAWSLFPSAAASALQKGIKTIPPGMVLIPFCYSEAAANMLTNPQLDPFGKIPEFKFCAARIERAAEPQAAE